MEKEIYPGVTLTVIPTKQFTTTQIIVSFTGVIPDANYLTTRSLLAYMLETSSQKWPTQKAVAQKLSQMYGASFGTTINRRGRTHSLSFVAGVVHDKYLQTDTDLVQEAVMFLKEMIFHPLVKEGAFDEDTFKLQKSNLATYMESVDEDPRLMALYGLRSHYFDDPSQKVPQFGTPATLKDVTNQDLYQAYRTMVTKDQVNIIVTGDVDPATITGLVATLPLGSRTKLDSTIQYDQPAQGSVRKVTVKQQLQQTKLNFMYHLPLDLNSNDFFAAIVFNALFGGDPQSKLFMNVREKSSMAYYASSNFDVLRNVLWVQTGIETANKEKVKYLVAAQLAALQQGDFTMATVENIKKSLINERISREDTQATLGTRALIGNLLGRQYSTAEWCQRIKNITKDDIVTIAQRASLQLVYCLEGGH